MKIGPALHFSVCILACLLSHFQIPGNTPLRLASWTPQAANETRERADYTLAESMFAYGLKRGEKNARVGRDYTSRMAKDPGLIAWFGFGAEDADSDTLGAELLQQMGAIPPHQRRGYFDAFVAGYTLGQTLNPSPPQRQRFASVDNLSEIKMALDL
jgi:hypothetical protein